MRTNWMRLIVGCVLMILAYFGPPSPLDKSPNTAALLFLTGTVLFSFAFVRE